MFRLISLIVILMIFAHSILASSPHDHSINGIITDSEGKPIPSATIRIENTMLGAIANKRGEFTIRGIPDGKYRLKISAVGYNTFFKEVDFEHYDGDDNSMKFNLTQSSILSGDVVVTATRNEVPQYEAPIIVSRISSQVFETTQSLSVSEGLNFTPGLRIENNCQNCGFTQVRMNGLEGPYSQVLINSRPIFSALAGVYGLDMLPTNMVDRIEVVRGAGSVLYGGNAIAGTINIITKDPMSNSFEIGLNQGYTNLAEPDRTITINGTVVSDDLNKGISFYGFNRERSPWDANDDGFSEMVKLDNSTIGFDAFWNTSDLGKLKIGGYSINEFRRGGSDFDLQPHQSEITEQLQHKILGSNISYEQYSKNLNHKISLYGSMQAVDRDSYYGGGGRLLTLDDEFTEDDILAINAYGVSEDISIVGGLQYFYKFNNDMNITAGSEYQYNDVKDRMPGYERLIDQQVGTIGTYAQLELKPIEKLTLLLGGRYDRVTINGLYDLKDETFLNERNLDVFVPRISAMYNITESFKARASFAQGYRAPQAFDEDLHINTVGGAALFTRLDPDLEMEKSNNLTASLNYNTYLGATQVNLVAEGFYTRLNNPFILSDQQELPNGIAVITKRNGEGATVQGVNLEANFAFSRELILQMGGTLQTALYDENEEIWTPDEDEEDEYNATFTNRLLRTPNAYGYLTINYSPIEELTISYSGVLTGTMDVPHVINVDNEYTVIKSTPSFFESNIKLTYNLYLNDYNTFQFFAGVQNIFNNYQEDFDRGAERDAGYVYGPSRPRTAYAGFKISFN